jgi:hypothetical protein
MVYKTTRTNKTKKKYKGGQPVDAVSETPTMMSNLKKSAAIGVQGINTLVDYGINHVAESIGTNPNESLEQSLSNISNKLDGIKGVINTPAGQKILYDISIIVKELANEALVPAIDEMSEVIVKKSEEISKQVIKIGLDAAGIVPVVGEVVEAIRTITDVIRAGEQVVETGAKITGISAETIGKMDDKKQQIQGLLSKLMNLVTDGEKIINTGISNGLTSAENGLKQMVKPITQIQPPIPITQIQPPMVGGLKNIKKIINIQKGSAKRAYMSQVEFLNPPITSLQHYNKYVTRKHKRKRIH